MNKCLVLILISFSFLAQAVGNQDICVREMREDWHHFLPKAIRHYPISDSVDTYQLHSNIRVYQPENFKRIIIWITGNAFIFDEPNSHDNFLCHIAESTESKILALSHRKIPEFTYVDIQNDIKESVDFIWREKILSEGIPVILAGDSSGAMLATRLLPHFLNKIPLDQLLFIAPGFELECFLKGDIDIEAFPKVAQEEVVNQFKMMQFISFLLFPEEEDRHFQWIESLQQIHQLPKITVICFEYDLFYPQAVMLKESLNNVTLDSRKNFHCHYLLKSSEDFLLQIDP